MDDLKAYFSIIILISITKTTDYKEIWGNKFPICKNINIIMGRNKFQWINRDLHANDNTEKNNDPLYKFRKVLEILNENMQMMYLPETFLSLEETITPFKGRRDLKVYAPKKPKRFGIKGYMLSEATSGYCVKFLIFPGRNDNENNIRKETNNTYNLFKQMLTNFKNCNRKYIIFFYSYYSSFKNLMFLHKNGFGFVASIRKNRKHFPKTDLNNNNQLKIYIFENIFLTSWKDKNY